MNRTFCLGFDFCYMFSQFFYLQWIVQPFFRFGNIEENLQMHFVFGI
jgi:hypothetical protein